MSKLKQISLLLPEYLLIAAVLFYWMSTAVILNPVAIILLTGLLLQIIFKNRITGIIIPSILLLLSAYLLLALFSEFKEFPSFNAEAQVFLFIGLGFLLGTITLSSIMLYRYLTINSIKPPQEKEMV